MQGVFWDMRLARSFFDRPTLEVAQDLLGKKLIYQKQEGIIYETEAYIGQDDPACHAAKGLTSRTQVMFGPAGHSYIYLIYGMYHCLNFVTEKEGFPAAVLIRGLWIPNTNIFLNGPGKVCQYLGLTKDQNNIDIITHLDFYLTEGVHISRFETTPRIGIKEGKDRLWRFVVSDRFISL